MTENPADIRREIEIATEAYLEAWYATDPIEKTMDERLERFHEDHPQTPAPWHERWEEAVLPAMEAATAAEHGRHLYQLHLRLARAERDPTSQQKATP